MDQNNKKIFEIGDANKKAKKETPSKTKKRAADKGFSKVEKDFRFSHGRVDQDTTSPQQ